jgi:hypothetical protein
MRSLKGRNRQSPLLTRPGPLRRVRRRARRSLGRRRGQGELRARGGIRRLRDREKDGPHQARSSGHSIHHIRLSRRGRRVRTVPARLVRGVRLQRARGSPALPGPTRARRARLTLPGLPDLGTRSVLGLRAHPRRQWGRECGLQQVVGQGAALGSGVAPRLECRRRLLSHRQHMGDVGSRGVGEADAEASLRKTPDVGRRRDALTSEGASVARRPRRSRIRDSSEGDFSLVTWTTKGP